MALRADVDEPMFRAYYRALAGVPPRLLEAACDEALLTRRFFPAVVELLQDAEVCRQRLLAATPFQPCIACRSYRPGWLTVVDPAGVRREARCACWRGYQAQLAGLGVPAHPVFVRALPAGRDGDGDGDGA